MCRLVSSASARAHGAHVGQHGGGGAQASGRCAGQSRRGWRPEVAQQAAAGESGSVCQGSTLESSGRSLATSRRPTDSSGCQSTGISSLGCRRPISSPTRCSTSCVGAGDLGGGELARREVGEGQTGGGAPRSHGHGHQVVVAALVEHPRLDDRALGDDAAHLALDQPLARLRHLLGDGDLVAGFHQLGDVAVDAVVGHARQRHALVVADRPAGEHHVADARHRLGVVVEGLVEVAQAKEQDAVGVLALEGQVLLAHGRGHSGSAPVGESSCEGSILPQAPRYGILSALGRVHVMLGAGFWLRPRKHRNGC